MTEQEKQILLQDLCSRLPYGVYVEDRNGVHRLTVGNTELADLFYGKCNIKPFLRPMSSMTESEIEEYIRLRFPDTIGVTRIQHVCGNSIMATVESLTSRESMRFWYNHMVSVGTIDFLNASHFDWRGLIPVGLALEATKNMYSI